MARAHMLKTWLRVTGLRRKKKSFPIGTRTSPNPLAGLPVACRELARLPGRQRPSASRSNSTPRVTPCLRGRI